MKSSTSEVRGRQRRPAELLGVAPSGTAALAPGRPGTAAGRSRSSATIRVDLCPGVGAVAVGGDAELGERDDVATIQPRTRRPSSTCRKRRERKRCSSARSRLPEPGARRGGSAGTAWAARGRCSCGAPGDRGCPAAGPPVIARKAALEVGVDRRELVEPVAVAGEEPVDLRRASRRRGRRSPTSRASRPGRSRGDAEAGAGEHRGGGGGVGARAPGRRRSRRRPGPRSPGRWRRSGRGPGSSRESATCWISASRCEDSSTVVRPSRPSRRISSRTSRMPAGSRPLLGSSRISSCGDLSRAAAMPRRCFMPSE